MPARGDSPSGPEWATRVVETHISNVFFVGDKAYKLKKPVRTDVLDWSTSEQRARACAEEVALNQRLSPDVYLGVAKLVGTDEQVCDSLVVMRRLPPERSLARLVRGGADVDPALRDLARLLASFHAECPTDAHIAESGTPARVAGNWQDNTEQLARYTKSGVLEARLVDAITALSDAYLGGRDRLFERRVAEGRVRDGHGDLQAADVFVLDDGPRVLDCIEFDPQLRYGDVLADVAFLAMDLERLGAPRQAATFLSWYQQFSGDRWPASLAHHWIAYRAQVRAKVACLRHDQGDPDAAAEAVGLLELCRRNLEHATMRLVLVGGSPGTGKSTVAAGMADQMDWALLSSDELRRQLDPVPDRPGGYKEGRYRPETTAVTYSNLLEQAGECLSLGQSVIIDASWTDASWRRKAATLARQQGARLVEIVCEVPGDVATARIRRRLAAGGDASEATPDIARRMAAEAAAWPTARHLDTAGAPAAAIATALDTAHADWAADVLRADLAR